MSLTIKQKLANIEESGWPIAYDGCHKIYFLQDAAREAKAREFGYDIYPASEVRDLYEGSCGLRFVTRWGYNNDDFEHPWNIEQGDEEDEARVEWQAEIDNGNTSLTFEAWWQEKWEKGS